MGVSRGSPLPAVWLALLPLRVLATCSDNKYEAKITVIEAKIPDSESRAEH